MIHRLTRIARAVAVTALLLPAAVACGAGDTADDTAVPPASTVPRAADAPGETAENPSPPAESESAAAFDPEALPVSDVPLGDFPYLSIPEGFENTNTEIPIAPFGRVPFWTGDHLEWVEGKVYQSPIYEEAGGTFFRQHLLAEVDAAVTGLGGVLVTDSEIPSAVTDTIPGDIRVEYVDGFGDIYNDPVQTYVIRRADRLIWIHLCANSAGGSWMIAESMT